MDYEHYIASEAWHRRRLCYFGAHERRCVACKSTSSVQLHHLSYEHIGDEPDEDLMALCQRCHTAVHAFHRAKRHLSLRAATLAAVRTIKHGRTERKRQAQLRALRSVRQQQDAKTAKNRARRQKRAQVRTAS